MSKKSSKNKATRKDTAMTEATKAVAAEPEKAVAADAGPGKDGARAAGAYTVATGDADLVVRDAPDGAKLRLLRDKTPVEVVDIDGGWAELSDGGFVMSKYIKEA